MTTADKERLAKLLAKMRAKQQQAEQFAPPNLSKQQQKVVEQVQAPQPAPPKKLDLSAVRARLATGATKPTTTEVTKIVAEQHPEPTPVAQAVADHQQHTDRYGNVITYNTKQQEFVDTASDGRNCILIGAAGTGKTTCMQGTVENLIHSGKAGILNAESHKYLRTGTPGIVVVSFTRRAVNNIKRAMSDDMKANCITIHKLLEYGPTFYEYFDEESGEMRKTMRFEPQRHKGNPLPSSIRTIIVEESSMVSLELYAQLIDAIGHRVQWIMLGDINQLPPVFGSAILGYKLLQWDVVELTEVYRQAQESPIIRLAHRILSGKTIPVTEFESLGIKHQLTIHPWKKKLKDELAVRTLAAFFTRACDEEAYNPDEDMILLPFNKACGTIELNKYIANHLARKHNRTTYEIMAGFNKHYFSEGDKVMYDKEDAVIVSIENNGSYNGGRVQKESKTLDYWGYNKNFNKDRLADVHATDDLDVDALLEEAATAEDRVRQASHVITLELLDTGDTISISSAAEVNSLIHGYAITVHKAQGSEWDKVFLCLHQSHASMLLRELLYTAVTRAKKELYIICEPNSLERGIERQKIKGNTLEAKAEHFKGKLDGIDDALLPYIHR